MGTETNREADPWSWAALGPSVLATRPSGQPRPWRTGLGLKTRLWTGDRPHEALCSREPAGDGPLVIKSFQESCRSSLWKTVGPCGTAAGRANYRLVVLKSEGSPYQPHHQPAATGPQALPAPAGDLRPLVPASHMGVLQGQPQPCSPAASRGPREGSRGPGRAGPALQPRLGLRPGMRGSHSFCPLSV